VRANLQKLETLPIAYMRRGSDNQGRRQEPGPVEPYVSRWDEAADWRGGPVATQILVGLRLDEIVYTAGVSFRLTNGTFPSLQ
jgi:hypothetical protein